MTGWIEGFLDLNREHMAEVVKDLMVSGDGVDRELPGSEPGTDGRGG